ncbi:MAG: PKD-like domain-containing protein, partial [Bacteroidota bacterium]
MSRLILSTLFRVSLPLLLFAGIPLAAQDFNEIIKVVASDREAFDRFGYSVSISGDYAIVGAYLEDDDVTGTNTLSDAGSAYIFERDGSGSWQEVQKLVASDRAAGDEFGWTVSISGDYAIVGARFESEDAAGMNTVFLAGSAYVFERDGSGSWQEVQKLVASDRADFDGFGQSVSISGDYAIVGAFGESEDATGTNTVFLAGSAYVFERDGSGSWQEVQKLVASDRQAFDSFGWSVSISSDYAVVGAYFEDEDATDMNTLSNAGSAYIFERDGSGSWQEVQKLVASDRAADDEFGWSVSISGDYAIIGGHFEDDDSAGMNTLSNAGSAYIFERDGSGSWQEAQKLVASDRAADDEFGNSVSISGDYAIVGALGESEDAAGMNTAFNAGSAYVFERDGSGSWQDVQKLVASDRAAGDQFSSSVSISGGYALIGAFGESQDATGMNTDFQAGSAYVFGPSTCDDIPVLTPQDITVESDQQLGIVFMTAPGSVPADSFSIEKQATVVPADATEFSTIGQGFNSTRETTDPAQISMESFFLDGTVDQGIVEYTVTPYAASGCEGDPVTYQVTVNPCDGPELVPQNITVESGQQIGIVFSTSAGSAAADSFTVVKQAVFTPPDATTFSTIGQGYGSTSETTDPAFISMESFFLNGTMDQGVIEYTVTPYAADGCVGEPVIYQVTVNPFICDLVVDCSAITDEQLDCRSDLPAVDFALPVVTDSCGDVIRSALTIIPGNSGCPEDTVFITRTYFLQDQEDNMAECMQTFTVVSDTDPTIVCPADGTVECGETPVVSAANAVTTDQCSNQSGATSVAGPVVVGDPNVAGTTYTYTYTYTDACG